MRVFNTVFAGLLIATSNLPAVEPTLKDVEFAKVEDYSLKLDIYYPPQSKDDETFPLIVWVHGGAWRAGSKDRMPIGECLDHGFAIASVDYRLSPQAKFPAQVHDIKAAIRYLRANHAKFRICKETFVIAGASAGGHLAALVGVSDGVEELEGQVGKHLSQDSAVKAIVSFYGASNLQTILGQSTEHGLSVRVPALDLLLGGQPKQKAELARLASPVAHVDPKDPPLWLLHGDADPQMPPKQSVELEKLYREHGVKVSHEVIKGAKHGGAVFYEADRIQRLCKELHEAIAGH